MKDSELVSGAKVRYLPHPLYLSRIPIHALFYITLLKLYSIFLLEFLYILVKHRIYTTIPSYIVRLGSYLSSPPYNPVPYIFPLKPRL
jgi:hypothetical protein